MVCLPMEIHTDLKMSKFWYCRKKTATNTNQLKEALSWIRTITLRCWPSAFLTELKRSYCFLASWRIYLAVYGQQLLTNGLHYSNSYFKKMRKHINLSYHCLWAFWIIFWSPTLWLSKMVRSIILSLLTFKMALYYTSWNIISRLGTV